MASSYDGFSFWMNEVRKQYEEWAKVIALLESELPLHPQPCKFNNWLPFPGTRPNLACPWIQDEHQQILNRAEVSTENYGLFCTPRLEIDARIHKEELKLDLTKLESKPKRRKKCSCKLLDKPKKGSKEIHYSPVACSSSSSRRTGERKSRLQNGFIRKKVLSKESVDSERSPSYPSSRSESITSESLRRFYAQLPPLDYVSSLHTESIYSATSSELVNV